MIRNFIFLFVIFVNFTSCSNKSKKTNFIFKNKSFIYDTYYIENKITNNLIKDSCLINISDNKIYVYDNSLCGNNKEWILGELTQINNKTLSSSHCGNSSIIVNLSSELTSIDTLNDNIIYNFHLLINNNVRGDRVFSKSFTYSKSEGILKVTEKDTIVFFPAFESTFPQE